MTHSNSSAEYTRRPGVTVPNFLIALLSSLGCAACQLAASDQLVGRAVLSAPTFAPGLTSGQQLGTAPINGQSVPFINKQPVQGFSALLEDGRGRYLAMSDNGFGGFENSSDFYLRVYRILPRFEERKKGTGDIQVLGFIELRDPDKKIPFTLTEQLTEDRYLTGADFDLESMQRAPDGSLWFGDEFGPYLLHTDETGKVLEAPFPLPDLDHAGKTIRAPQNPQTEEASAVRVMNALRHHARIHGSKHTPVFSPYYLMLDDGNPATGIDHRAAPPAGSGLHAASSDVFNVASLQSAGYPVVTWTVNDLPTMLALLTLKVNGIISDRPDLLLQAVQQFDANADGIPGDYLTLDGLIDSAKFDAQGHRGGRNLRPENTLPAMEVALDNLVTTLELDCGLTSDGVALLTHDPYIEAAKARRVDGGTYGEADEVLIKNLTAAQIQSTFIADKVFRGPEQSNDPALSPVSLAFFGFDAAAPDASRIYRHPKLEEVFAFVAYYANHYGAGGAGSGHPQAAQRAKNAKRVRFNIETKINPRTDKDSKGNVFSDRTRTPEAFVQAIAAKIVDLGLQDRADIQSFDFRSLLVVHEKYPALRTVALVGDFPIFADPAIAGSDDGANLQPQGSNNTPWLAGLIWPYRSTKLNNEFRAQTSGGFEGMALTADGRALLPLLEKPLTGAPANTLFIHRFDLRTKTYQDYRYIYPFDARGIAIGDFVMFDKDSGVVIERDGSQGRLDGFKAVFEIKLKDRNEAVKKRLAVDLMNLSDPHGISLPSEEGDVGLGQSFAMPFTTIEDIIVFDRKHIGIINDNNFPFSVGRHVGSGAPDDTEFVIIKLDTPLGTRRRN